MQQNEQAILAECQKIVDELMDGGIWGIPRSMVVFRVDKKNKNFILLEGDCEEELKAFSYWYGKLGYSVIRK